MGAHQMINRRLGVPFGWLLVLMPPKPVQVTQIRHFLKIFFISLI